MKAAIIGGGVIGGGWAARFLLNGWDVTVYDPAPDAEQKIDAVLANARRSLPALYDAMLPAEGTLRFADDRSTALNVGLIKVGGGHAGKSGVEDVHGHDLPKEWPMRCATRLTFRKACRSGWR